jgi:hypothetical protein
MLLSLALPAVAAALLSLDRRAFMQSMLGRPLTTGVIVGAAISEPLAGLSLGLWTELLWLWRLTSGGYHTPNTPLALSAVLLALFGEGAPGPPDFWARAVLGFAMVPALAQLLILPDALLRKVAARRSRRLRELLARAEAQAEAEARAMAAQDAQAAKDGQAGPPEGAGPASPASASGALAPAPGSPTPGAPAPAARPVRHGPHGPIPDLPLPAPVAARLWETAGRAFRREALLGLPETFIASLACLALAVPALRLATGLLAAWAPPSFWAPLAAFAPYAPAAGLLAIASSLSRQSLPPYLLGALCALAALAAMRALGAAPLP